MKAMSCSMSIGELVIAPLRSRFHSYQLFRVRWRHIRARRLEAEEISDEKSRKYEEQEAENLRKESEEFLARQMDEMQSLAEEQRKAGMLLDDGAPVRLNVSIAAPMAGAKEHAPEKAKTNAVFVQDEEEEDALKKRKVPLVKLDFSVAESSEQIQERLLRIKDSVPREAELLFKSKVRWDALPDVGYPHTSLGTSPDASARLLSIANSSHWSSG